MYKIVTKFMNGTKTEHTAAMYSIAMIYASNVAKGDGVISATIYNSSGEECAKFNNYTNNPDIRDLYPKMDKEV